MSSRYPTDCIGSEKKMGSGCKFCIGGMNVNCVGIDGSKGKSMIAVMQPLGEMVIPPFEVGHTDAELCELSRRLGDLDGEPRIVMEATGNYHLPVACFLCDSGFYVSAVNAMLLHGYGNNSLRRAKTDKKDAIKLANYGLDHWLALPRYIPEDQDTALDICASACGHFSVMPKSDTAKLLVEQAVSQLRATSISLTALRNEIQSLAASLPEYPMEIRSRRSSKLRSSALRRTLFLVMSAILQRSPADNPVYQFMDKKRAEGKPYRVYMMASANKFLRICYATVKQYLDSLEA